MGPATTVTHARTRASQVCLGAALCRSSSSTGEYSRAAAASFNCVAHAKMYERAARRENGRQTNTAEPIGTDSSVFVSPPLTFFSLWLLSDEGLTPPPPLTDHNRSNIQHDISLKKNNKKIKGRKEKKMSFLAVSFESYHVELHGYVLSGFLGILAVAHRE